VSIVDANRIEGEALFGQATFGMADNMRLTVGGRYGRDDRTGRGRFFDGSGLAPYMYERDFDNFDYKVGLDYDLTQDVMLYLATQTGFQPGTFNPYASTPQASNAVEPAELTAYTAGVKSRLLDDRLQINDEVFLYDYEGLFASAYNTVINTVQTFNAQKVEIYGNQLDLIWRAAQAARVSLSVGYLHARNVRFDLPDGTASFAGYQLQYAPDWTVSLGYWHDLFIGAGHVHFAASTRYEDAFYADFSHTPGGRQQSYFKSDASVTYFSAGNRWSLGAWIKNIEDEAVIAATAGGSNLPPLATGATAFLEAPRTYGLRCTLTF
jgi:iron complex outermembrane receptor protein